MNHEINRVYYFNWDQDRLIINFDVTCDQEEPFTVVEACIVDHWLAHKNPLITFKPMLGMRAVTDTLLFLNSLAGVKPWWVKKYCVAI